ncbi:MAG: MFS transporter [Pseudomonadota bacterium]
MTALAPEPTARFLRRAAPALGVGFALTFASSFGQTYFLSLFGGVWRETFSLSHGQFGGLYTAATLASAGGLLVLGKVVDRYAPPQVGIALLALTALAATSLAFAGGVVMLALGLFAVRMLGQGLLSHVGMTAMAKWFDAARGRALGIAMLGFPVGEALLPPLVASGLVLIGWRWVWLAVAAACLLALAPTVAALATSVRRGRLDDDAAEGPAGAEATRTDSWTRAQVLRDWRFYAAAPGLLSTPFIITSVLFHQVFLVETKGWTLTQFASLFPLYAAASTGAGLACGRLVDAYGARRILPYYLLPLVVGLVALTASNAFGVAVVFMALTGATAGAAVIIYTALWAELYGPAHIGAIRAVAGSALVLSSAIGPGLCGALIDAGVSLDAQLRAMAAYAALCAVLFAPLQNRMTRRPPPSDAAK